MGSEMCIRDRLNDDLQESYNSGLLGGSALRIPIRTWELQTVFLPADNVGQFDLALSKNYTRLASLHCIFNQNPPTSNRGTDKLVNTSYFPGGAAIEDLEAALHLGSRRMPDNNIRGS